MNEAERKYIARQYNYNHVPHPLLDGLVFVSFGPVHAAKAMEYLETMKQKIVENETAKMIDTN